MRRSRLLKILMIVLVLMASITIAYSALSTTLRITGTSTVKESSWDIKFVPYDANFGVETTGGATYTLPTIDRTTLKNYKVNLTKPGDSVSFKFKIKNNGNISGVIDKIVLSTPTCTSKTGNTTDAELICNNLKYEIHSNNSYSTTSGTYIENHPAYDTTVVCKNTNAGLGYSTDYEHITLTIGFDSAATKVPSSQVEISNLTLDYYISQHSKDNSCYYNGSNVAEPSES